MSKRKIHFITGNKNKLAEVEAIIGGLVDLSSQSLDLVEIQGTIEDISKDKAIRAAAQVNGPVLVEDTCLCFTALKELPGPYIKWFLEALGHIGLNNLLVPYEDKSAQAVCTFAYCEGPGFEPMIFQGRTDVKQKPLSKSLLSKKFHANNPQGRIVPPRSRPDIPPFGWDAIFEFEGLTYAEMEKAEKNKISHRSRALAKLRRWLDMQD